MTVDIVALRTRGRDARNQTGKYKSVSIRAGENACGPVKKYGGRRLLVSEAPTLPLSTCSAKTCSCNFFTYGDRRSCLTNRRTNSRDVTTASSQFSGRDRRKGTERRRLKVDFLG